MCDAPAFQAVISSVESKFSVTSWSMGRRRNQRVNCSIIRPAAMLAVKIVLLAVQEPA